MLTPVATDMSIANAEIAAPRANDHRIAQNWILDPFQDAVFVIAAPILVLAVALLLFRMLGAEAATSFILVGHIVFTVAHHLPTFIRVYGDVDLFQRFKWSFVLGPVVPLVFSAAVLGYIHYKQYPVEYFLYLYIMLALWDPWHFLRQHYGFMRIYDRPNTAPRRIAARMDLGLCVTWFVYIMLASGAWLASMLHDMSASVGMAVLRLWPEGAFAVLLSITKAAAIGMTLVYASYLMWCRRNGYYISAAKVALAAITFGVMFIAYTPNEWMRSLAPDWSFKVGFAAIGIVHMTQYLAIVWRYNRGLASRAGRARTGWFERLHSRGGWLIGGAYVLICLAYGEIVTTERESRWVMSILLAIGFTSTLLHYYFDGFIWKIRHEQNRENLNLDTSASKSWWTAARKVAPGAMALRQIAYFGVPMVLLTVGAVSVWSAPAVSSIEYMQRAQMLSQQGDAHGAAQEATAAFVAMRSELPLQERIVEIDPTAAHSAELAFLIYNHSYYENVVLPSLAGREVNATSHRRNAQRAAQELERATAHGGALWHPGREQLSQESAARTIASWRRIADQY